MRFFTTLPLIVLGASAIPLTATTAEMDADITVNGTIKLDGGIEIPAGFVKYIYNHLPDGNGTESACPSKRDLVKRSCDWQTCAESVASQAVTCAQALADRKPWDVAKCLAAVVALGANVPAPCQACV